MCVSKEHRHCNITKGVCAADVCIRHRHLLFPPNTSCCVHNACMCTSEGMQAHYYTHTHMHPYIHTPPLHTDVCAYATYAHTYIYVYIRTHTYTYAHTCTRIHTEPHWSQHGRDLQILWTRRKKSIGLCLN